MAGREPGHWIDRHFYTCPPNTRPWLVAILSEPVFSSPGKDVGKQMGAWSSLSYCPGHIPEKPARVTHRASSPWGTAGNRRDKDTMLPKVSSGGSWTSQEMKMHRYAALRMQTWTCQGCPHEPRGRKGCSRQSEQDGGMGEAKEPSQPGRAGPRDLVTSVGVPGGLPQGTPVL